MTTNNEYKSLEIAKKKEANNIYNTLLKIENTVEQIKEGLRKDDLDDFNLRIMRLLINDLDNHYIYYKLDDNQIKLLNRK